MTQQFVQLLNRINDEILKNPEIDIIEQGILDSLGVMRLIAEIETDYDIEIDPDDIEPENFSSAEKIWLLLQKYEK